MGFEDLPSPFQMSYIEARLWTKSDNLEEWYKGDKLTKSINERGLAKDAVLRIITDDIFG